MESSTDTRFLIFIDILGFEEFPRLIAQETNQYSDVFRETYIEEPFKECIEKNQDIFQILTKGTDDCLLLVKSIDTVIKCIDIFSTIPLKLPGYSFIPVEIAVDYITISSRVKKPINTDNVISALKNNILRLYKSNYENTNNGKKIDNTFIIATPRAYKELKVTPVENQTKLQKRKYVQISQDFISRERKISVFFENLRIEKSDYSGSFIDKIYIEPDEFEEIQKQLHTDRVIFITGPPGFGKTYLAIRLLWLGFKEGYIPKWIRCNDEFGKPQKEFIEFFDLNIKDKEIVYIEDPFGKITFKQNDELLKRFSILLEFIKQKDVFVVFTSRKDVFEAFEKTCYSPDKIREIEQEINVIKPSYNFKKRKEICAKWAEEKGCIWLKNRKLKSKVLSSLKDPTLLSTPLSIHDFIQATSTISDEKLLLEKIHEYSKETWAAFGEEIVGLCESKRRDHVLLLSLIFITDILPYSTDFSFFEGEYNQLKSQEFDDFEIVFRDEKHRLSITKRFSESKSPDEDIVRFAHPIYAKSLNYLLKNKCFRTIFFEVFEHLYLNEDLFSISEIVNDYYTDIPRALRNRILYNKLIENIWNNSEIISTIGIDATLFDKKRKICTYERNFVSTDILSAIVKDFNQLPKTIQQLFFIVSKNENNAYSFARALLSNSQSLSEELIDLLIQLCETEETSKSVTEALHLTFLDVPEVLREKIIRILLTKPKNSQVIFTLTDYYSTLPLDITDNLIDYSNNHDYIWELSEGIIRNFKCLPPKIQDLVFQLANNEETANDVAIALEEYFEDFSEPERSKLLEDLSNKTKAIPGLSAIYCMYYKNIPPILRKKIFDFLDGYENVEDFSREIAFNYRKLPKTIKNLLFKYASDENRSADVAYAIFDELEEQDLLPTKIQKRLLSQLSIQPSAKDGVIAILYSDESQFDFGFINKTLKKLVTKNPAIGDFSLPLLCHFEKFDPDLRAAMFEETVLYNPHEDRLEKAVERYRNLIPSILIEFWLEQKELQIVTPSICD